MSSSDNELEPNGEVLAYAADLMFASKIRGTARGQGTELVMVSRPGELPDHVRTQRPRLVLVDLDARGGDAVEAIRAMKVDAEIRDVRVVAFASHRAAERIQAAREAGADSVLARSAFVQQLPTLLRRE